MSATPREIIVTARSLLETPYLHQGRVPGKDGGLDCIGVPIVIINRLQLIGTFFDFTAYGRDGSGILEKTVAQYCKPLPEPRPGAMLLFKTTPEQTVAQHCGVCTDWGSELGMVHAYQNVGFVREHELIKFWQDRLVSVYAFPLTQY